MSGISKTSDDLEFLFSHEFWPWLLAVALSRGTTLGEFGARRDYKCVAEMAVGKAASKNP
jgi:hypothetical protein